MTEPAQPRNDASARQRLDTVVEFVVQRCASALDTMVNEIILKSREDKKFRSALMTPGVELAIKVAVPHGLEKKILVLLAECLAADRVDTLRLAMAQIQQAPGANQVALAAVQSILEEAEAERTSIGQSADRIRSEQAAREQRPPSPGIVLPEGIGHCSNCGSVAKLMAPCSICGTYVGAKL